MGERSMERIRECLWPGGLRRPVWMIVDAARDRAAYRMLLQGFYSDRACLFSGALTPEMELAAPYLVELDRDGEATEKLVRQAWGKSWGIFLVANTSLVTLRRHLRTLLVVKDQKGRRMMFRYYDPRVLRLYLPTCTGDELRTVFGPVEGMLMEDEAGERMLEFGMAKGTLLTKTHVV
jgi:hypothetical protein